MSVSKAEKSRFWLAYFLRDMPVGTEFSHGELHLTIIPWFVSDLADEKITLSFNENFSDSRALQLRMGEKARFGPKKDAPITLIEPSAEFAGLHAQALLWFDSLEGRWAVKNPYVGAQYQPHIRRRRGTKLPRQLAIDSLSLVKATRQEDGLRYVAAKVRLK